MKWLVILLPVLLLSAPYLHATEEKGRIEITLYGSEIKTISREMNESEIMEIIGELKNLQGNNASIKSVLSILEEKGLKEGRYLAEENITNYLAFIMGFGRGIALYTADLAFLMLMLVVTGNVFAAIIFTSLFVMISHLFPARFLLPVSLIGIEEGSITTLGVKGVRNIEGDALLAGFIGIMINFYIPAQNSSISPLFIAGYSLAVLPNPFG